MADDFQTAYNQAQNRVGEARWAALTVHERANAIYEALRALDEKRVVASRVPSS
jgi:hypothetical protein